MDALQKTNPGTTEGNSVAATTPSQSSPGSGVKLSATTPSSTPVPLFGGYRGGRTRRDGLKPGSPEAVEADKKKDRERKVAARQAAAALAEPPPLPSAPPSMGNPGSTPIPDLVGDGSNPTAPPLPWQPEALNNLVSQLIDACEDGRAAVFLAKCEESNLTPKLIKELEKDARFPKTAVVMLKNALPRLAAKYLNKSGISSEYECELSCITALVLIVKHTASSNARLDELIETNKALLRKQKEAESAHA